MAVQLYQPRSKPNAVLRLFAQQAGTAIREHFRVQKVFPYEVYPGYKEQLKDYPEDERPTGAGFRSIHVTSDATPGSESITISFLEHLRFAEMGTMWRWVAGHRTTLKFDQVEHDRRAKFDRRYVTRWSTKQGETHRPIIMMEARHVQARMTNYFQDYWGKELEFNVLQGFQDIELKF